MINLETESALLQDRTKTPNVPLHSQDLASAASLFPDVPDGFPETKDNKGTVLIKQGHFRVQLRLPLENGGEEALEIYLPVSEAKGHALVPRDNIFGTQPPNDYDEREMRGIRKMMHNPMRAVSYLAHNPIVCAVVPDMRSVQHKTTRIIALDGHHRNRALTFNNMPVAYFTAEDLAKGARRINSVRRDKPVTPEEMIQALNHTADLTMDLFDRLNMDPSKHPVSVSQTSVSSFTTRFPHLIHNGKHLQQG